MAFIETGKNRSSTINKNNEKKSKKKEEKSNNNKKAMLFFKSTTQTKVSSWILGSCQPHRVTAGHTKNENSINNNSRISNKNDSNHATVLILMILKK